MYTRVPVEVFAADCGYGVPHMENEYNYRALIFQGRIANFGTPETLLLWRSFFYILH